MYLKHLSAASISTLSTYMHAKSALRLWIEKIPGFGKPTLRVMERLRDAVKTILVGDRFFEVLGFSYSGPINGHDIPGLIRAFKVAARSSRPVVVHVVTQKGHGYLPAQQKPDQYHGLSPKDSVPSKELASTGQAAAEYLIQEAQTDPRICTVVAAMPSGTQMDRFFAKYPDRSFDVGIAEEHAVEMAAGMAAGGMRPFVAVYSTFLQRSLDQIQMDVCLPCLPVTFLLDRSGLVGDDGATHQGLYDLTYLRQMPNMAIAAPSNIADLQKLMELSIGQNNPMDIRYPKALPIVQYAEEKEFVFGEGSVLREGKDAAVFALGPLVGEAMIASEILSEKGIDVAVVDARFVKPLDENLIDRYAASCPIIFTLEENTLSGGFGSAVLEYAAKKRLRTVIRPMGAPDRFVSHAKIAQQRQECGLDAKTIADTIHTCLHIEINS